MKIYTLQKNEHQVKGIILTKDIEKIAVYYSKWFYIVDKGNISLLEFLRILIIEAILKHKEEFREIIKWVCNIINMIFIGFGFFMFFYIGTILSAEYIKKSLAFIWGIFWIIILFRLMFRSIKNTFCITIMDILKVFMSYIIFLAAKETLPSLAIELFLYRIISITSVSFLIIIFYNLFDILYSYHKDYYLIWCK